jgi:hypothetical protein
MPFSITGYAVYGHLCPLPVGGPSFLFARGIAVWQCNVDIYSGARSMNTMLAGIAIISITGILPGG